MSDQRLVVVALSYVNDHLPADHVCDLACERRCYAQAERLAEQLQNTVEAFFGSEQEIRS